MSGKAVVLLSGGLDSVTALFIAMKRDGCECHALSFDYGQRHVFELEAAERIAHAAGVERTLVRVDRGLFRGTSLVDRSMDVPKGRAIDESIPTTYVPARNTLFLAHALCLSESIGAQRIYIGANALDYSGYPDCRPEFIAAFERVAALGTKMGSEGRPIGVHAPLIRLSKGEIIREGKSLGVDYSLTSSCYDPKPSGRPCESCDSCLLRAKGFAEAGEQDPLLAK